MPGSPPLRAKSLTSKYVGVCWDKKANRWLSQIQHHGKWKFIGNFDDELAAARMYDEEAAAQGKPVNFPQNPQQQQAVKMRKDRSQMPNITRPSKYVGVNWSKKGKRWKSCIRINGKKTFLGCYDDEDEAARVYDLQAMRFGKPVNFPSGGQRQAVKPRKDKSGLPDVLRKSSYVGVTWNRAMKKWETKTRINGQIKGLGYFDLEDEKKAALNYDEQAALQGKPVNFPKHPGQEQAVKRKKKSVWTPTYKEGNDVVVALQLRVTSSVPRQEL